MNSQDIRPARRPRRKAVTVAGARYILEGDRWLSYTDPFAITTNGLVSYRTLPISPALMERATAARDAFREAGIAPAAREEV